ncbi:hypothetical protein DV736_g5663, partial [Chaetothyriales sp. CBS 134916]
MDTIANTTIEAKANGDAVNRDQKSKGKNTPDVGTAIDIQRDSEVAFPGDAGSFKAWIVLFGCFISLFPSFGFMVSIGTLQDYWHLHQLKTYSPRDIGWIGGVFVYIALAFAICIGPLFDRYGPRWIALIGSTAYVAMMFLLAECKEYWQLLLCLGVLGGFSGATLTTTGLAVVNHWFKEKRGLASGIAMSGSSFGGVIIPLILRATLTKYSYPWAIRILGFLFLGCLIIGNVLMEPRIPPSAEARSRGLFSMHLFGNPEFSFLTLSVFGIEVVLFGALGILPTYASIGADFPTNTGFNIIAVLNGVSCVGRFIPGFVSDAYGRFNVLGVMMLATLIVMLVIWLPFAHKHLTALYIFAAMFGFGTGSWITLYHENQHSAEVASSPLNSRSLPRSLDNSENTFPPEQPLEHLFSTIRPLRRSKSKDNGQSTPVMINKNPFTLETIARSSRPGTKLSNCIKDNREKRKIYFLEGIRGRRQRQKDERLSDQILRMDYIRELKAWEQRMAVEEMAGQSQPGDEDVDMVEELGPTTEHDIEQLVSYLEDNNDPSDRSSDDEYDQLFMELSASHADMDKDML